jgi:hypothetical protein
MWSSYSPLRLTHRYVGGHRPSSQSDFVVWYGPVRVPWMFVCLNGPQVSGLLAPPECAGLVLMTPGTGDGVHVVQLLHYIF